MENVKYIPGDMMEHISTGDICKMVSISTNKNCVIEEYDSHNWMCTDMGKLSSILLTPQILEANGWKKGNLKQDEKCLKAFYYPYSNENSVFCIRYYESVNMFVPYVGITPLTDKMFMYVHQLQHLLFGLGLPSELKV